MIRPSRLKASFGVGSPRGTRQNDDIQGPKPTELISRKIVIRLDAALQQGFRTLAVTPMAGALELGDIFVYR